jgi:DNA-3-methyladenine glycosylase I
LPAVPPFRCFGDGSDLYEAYHDDEWGRPVTAERELLERLCLEGFQSGLAWITILRKRDAFRVAFADFEPDKLALFGEDDVARLMQDAGIVRNRLKIEATIANGRALLDLREEGVDLVDVIWSYAPETTAPPAETLGDLQPQTPESKALSKDLKKRGFRFVGPTTVYATMQACGIVNDHLAQCHVREAVERERQAARGRVLTGDVPTRIHEDDS